MMNLQYCLGSTTVDNFNRATQRWNQLIPITTPLPHKSMPGGMNIAGSGNYRA
jgi:hypothetical protein